MTDRRRTIDAAALLGTSTAAFVLAVVASTAIVAISGVSPLAAGSALWEGAFGDLGRVAGTLDEMLPMTLAALGWIVAFTARRINIGLEGQILAGGVVATTIGLTISGVPAIVHLPLAALGGVVGGALYAGIAAWLWARRHVNDIISTLLLNLIAIQLVAWLVRGPLEEPTHTLAQTLPVADSARWPSLVAGTALGWDFVLMVALTFAATVLLGHTTFGFKLRLTGANEEAARHAGIPTTWIGVSSLLVSGGFAGLAGSSLILGGEAGNMADNFSAGFGFDGIVVALLARNRPVATLPAALLFAALRQGGGLMEARVGVPSALVEVTQGLVIVLVAGGAHLLERRQARRVVDDTGPPERDQDLEVEPA